MSFEVERQITLGFSAVRVTRSLVLLVIPHDLVLFYTNAFI